MADYPVPDPASLTWLTPTLVNDLVTCGYRVAWRLDSRYKWLRRPTPWTELGVAAHACVEDIGRGLLEGIADREEARHRIEAACLPQNVASISLLERNGFQREGFARAYLKIDGAWRDHVLYALIEHEAPRGF